jgi:hypothetical protein
MKRRTTWSMMPKGVKRFSDDITLYLFDLEPDANRQTLNLVGRRQAALSPSAWQHW